MGNVTQIGWDGTVEVVAENLPDLTPQPTLSDYQIAVQGAIDGAAKAVLFHDGVTMASYIASTVAPWAAQAEAFIAWRDAVWQYAYAELEKVQAGERGQPSITEFLAELPEIAWPEDQINP